MTALTFALLSLAAYRAARAVSLDTITEPMRDWLDDVTLGTHYRKLYELMACGFCTSFWLAGVTYLAYLLATEQWSDSGVVEHGIVWWAIAGSASLLIAIDTFFMREAPPDE
jgi:FtsH-binding integral membrane protein